MTGCCKRLLGPFSPGDRGEGARTQRPPHPPFGHLLPRFAREKEASCIGFLAGLALLATSSLALPADRVISQYAHRAWKIEDGLPNSVVKAIAQTNDGYLWVGTYDGLARYNGDTFERIGLRRDTVLSFRKARDGALWIGTSGGGVAVYSHGLLRTISRKEGLPSDSVPALIQAADGTMWIGTTAGICSWRQGKLELVLSTESAYPYAIAEAGGIVWVGTRGTGLLALKDGKLIRTYPLQDGGYSLYADRDGTLWIGTGRGLARMRGGVIEMISGFPVDQVMSILRDSDGTLWAGSYGHGLYRSVDGEHFTNYSTKEGLLNNSVRTLFEDAEKTFWVGTNGGLERFTAGRFVTVGAAEGLQEPYARTVLQDRAGNVWIGTAQGLARLDPNGNVTTLSTKDGLTSDYIFALAQDPDGAMWAGTPTGLNRIGEGTVRHFDEKDGLLSASVRALHVDRRGVLWIGSDRGLNWYRNGHIESPPMAGFEKSFVQAFVDDKNGGTWFFGDGRGIAHWTDGRITTYGERDGLTDPRLFAAVVGPDDALWIGSDSRGLFRLKNGVFQHFAIAEGVPDDKVLQMLDDGKALWLGGSRGITRIDWSQLKELAERRRKTVSGSSFGYADGMRSVQCNGSVYPSAARTRDGRLWFPTVNGVATIRPEVAANTNRRAPPVVIEQVIVDGQPVSLEKLALDPGKEKFEFHYSGLSFVAPEKVLFRYKLEGFDKEWVEAGTRHTAYYTNIPPGRYRFLVKACNNDGVWNEAGSAIAFELLTPLWKTRWAYMLYILAIATAIYSFVRLRVRSLHARAATLEQMVRTRTAELETIAAENARLYDTARAATLAKSQFLANMSHEIRTPLNAILGFVQLMMRKESRDPDDRENLGIIMRSGHHLLNLINDVLSMAKIEAGMVSLTDTTFDPHALFQLLRETFVQRAAAKQLDLRFEISADFPSAVRADEAKLRQILFNLLGNAFKFTRSGAVTLRARWSAGVAHLEVQDTGCGLTAEEIATLFKPFVQTEKGAAAREGTGLGLAICRSYLHLMRGQIRIESEPGKGSTFIIDVPLIQGEGEVAGAPVRKVIALAPGQPRYRMLVADDTAENRILLEKFLVSFGFDVRSAVNGRDALTVWSDWQPDLVWMDIRMPVIDGYDATRRIRDIERRGSKRTPVIAITASVFEHDREKILASGCDDMVLKPFVEAHLFDMLTKYLGIEWEYLDEENGSKPANISPALLATLPHSTLEKLRDAVTAGDIETTYQLTDEIEKIDPLIADALRTMLKGYRLDEIQAAVEH